MEGRETRTPGSEITIGSDGLSDGGAGREETPAVWGAGPLPIEAGPPVAGAALGKAGSECSPEPDGASVGVSSGAGLSAAGSAGFEGGRGLRGAGRQQQAEQQTGERNVKLFHTIASVSTVIGKVAE